jgi:hypothetical protein
VYINLVPDVSACVRVCTCTGGLYQVMTVPRGRADLQAMYYALTNRKRYTYRGVNGVNAYVHTHRFVCVVSTKDEMNCVGSFKLAEGIECGETFEFNDVFREEWGWSRKLFERGYRAYRIYDRVLFSEHLHVGYFGLGVSRVGNIDVPKLDAAMLRGLRIDDDS